MTTIEPDQKAIVQELYSRREGLDPQRRAVVEELAGRFGLSPGASGSWQPTMESFTADHPIASFLPRVGQGAVDAAKGAVSSIYHALVDPSTPEEAGLEGHPVPRMLKRLLIDPQIAEARKAIDLHNAAGLGGSPEAFGHGLASMVPVLGPIAAHFGERMASGEVPEAIGEFAFALAAPDLTNEGAGLVHRTALSTVGALREKARSFAQSATKASAFKTTEPIVDRFAKADTSATDKQTRINENAAVMNKEAQVAAAEKNAAIQAKQTGAEQAVAAKTTEQQSAIDLKNELARHEADIATEQQKAVYDKKVADQQSAHAQAVKEATEHNIAVDQAQQQAMALDGQLRQGSAELGQRVKDLEAKTKVEADEKYAPIHAATKGDGESLGDIAAGARGITESTIKGSSENIKQFRDIVRKAKDAEGNDFLDTLDSNMDVVEENPEDIVKLPYDQIHGYYSEIADKLAKDRGKMPGDVRQAMKQLGTLMRDAMIRIEERNGVGPQGRDASAYWASRQELLYGKKSAISQVRERVGVLDPEFLSEPFTKGKSAGVAIDRLKTLPTKHTAETNAIANLAGQLKESHATRKGMKIPKPKEMPVPPVAINPPSRTYAELKAAPGQSSASSLGLTDEIVRRNLGREVNPSELSLDRIKGTNPVIIDQGGRVAVGNISDHEHLMASLYPNTPLYDALSKAKVIRISTGNGTAGIDLPQQPTVAQFEAIKRIVDRNPQTEFALDFFDGTSDFYANPIYEIYKHYPELSRRTQLSGPNASFVKPKIITPRQIERPVAPTVQDLMASKAHAVRTTASNIGTLSKFDLAYPAEIVTGIVAGHPIIGALMHPLVKFGTAALLDHPAIVDWISKPVPADLGAIEKLPEPARAQIKANLKAIIDQERGAGRNLTVSPAVRRIIQAGTIPQNRREAMEALGRAPQ